MFYLGLFFGFLFAPIFYFILTFLFCFLLAVRDLYIVWVHRDKKHCRKYWYKIPFFTFIEYRVALKNQIHAWYNGYSVKPHFIKRLEE